MNSQRAGLGDARAAFPAVIADRLLGFFKLLSDETRLKIMYLLLRNGELNVRSLCSQLGMNQPAVSHHLAVLRLNGLVERRREGKRNYYFVVKEGLSEVVDAVRGAWPDADAIIR